MVPYSDKDDFLLTHRGSTGCEGWMSEGGRGGRFPDARRGPIGARVPGSAAVARFPGSAVRAHAVPINALVLDCARLAQDPRQRNQHLGRSHPGLRKAPHGRQRSYHNRRSKTRQPKGEEGALSPIMDPHGNKNIQHKPSLPRGKVPRPPPSRPD